MIKASLLFLGLGALGMLEGWMHKNLAYLIVGLLTFLVGLLSLPFSTSAQREAIKDCWGKLKAITSRFLSLIFLISTVLLMGGSRVVLQLESRIMALLGAFLSLGLFFFVLLHRKEKSKTES